MKQKTKKTIELVNFLHHILNKKKLLKSNQSMVLAISGGQDSISLFFIFLQLKDQWNWKLSIIYCNHLWQKDSFYTMLHLFKLAYLLNIPIYLTVTLQNIFTEQKARNWRSLTFQRITGFYLFSLIVLGHSKSDRVETGLFNLFRGSSTKGVSSLNWTKVVLKDCFFKLSKTQLNQTSYLNKNIIFVKTCFIFWERKNTNLKQKLCMGQGPYIAFPFYGSQIEDLSVKSSKCFWLWVVSLFTDKSLTPKGALTAMYSPNKRYEALPRIKDTGNRLPDIAEGDVRRCNRLPDIAEGDVRQSIDLTSNIAFGDVTTAMLLKGGNALPDIDEGDVRQSIAFGYIIEGNANSFSENIKNSNKIYHKKTKKTSVLMHLLRSMISQIDLTNNIKNENKNINIFKSLKPKQLKNYTPKLFLTNCSIYLISNKSRTLASYVLKLNPAKREYFTDKEKMNFNKYYKNWKETKKNLLRDKFLIKTYDKKKNTNYNNIFPNLLLTSPKAMYGYRLPPLTSPLRDTNKVTSNIAEGDVTTAMLVVTPPSAMLDVTLLDVTLLDVTLSGQRPVFIKFLFPTCYRFVLINQSQRRSTKIFVLLLKPPQDIFLKKKSLYAQQRDKSCTYCSFPLNSKLINKKSITNIIKKFLMRKVEVHFKRKFLTKTKKKRFKNFQHHIFALPLLTSRIPYKAMSGNASPQSQSYRDRLPLLTPPSAMYGNAMNFLDTFVYTSTIGKEEKQKLLKQKSKGKNQELQALTKTLFLVRSKEPSLYPFAWKFLSRLSKHEYLLVRPFLSLTRFDLKKICNSWKIPLFPDQSNQKLKYQRNRIRKQILPTLRFFFNPQIDTTISQFIEIINSEQEYMDFITGRIVKKIQYKKETVVQLETSFLAVLPIALRRMVMKQFLEKIMNGFKFFDIEKVLQQVSIERGLIRQEDTFLIKKKQKKINKLLFKSERKNAKLQASTKTLFLVRSKEQSKALPDKVTSPLRDTNKVTSNIAEGDVTTNIAVVTSPSAMLDVTLFVSLKGDVTLSGNARPWKKSQLETKNLNKKHTRGRGQKDVLVDLINKKKTRCKIYKLIFFPKTGSIFLQSQRVFFIKKDY